MGTTEEVAQAQTKPKKSKSRSERRAAKTSRPGSGAEKLKTVVRRLPPNLPEEVFWQSVQPWVTTDTVSWKMFYPGKVRKTYNKENVPSRAYIAFKNAEQLATFSSAYDGHIFRDKAGNESYAVVEFAPCQKVPSEKKKADPRIGTIEQDEDYISFIESLKTSPSKPSDSEALEVLIASTQPVPEPKSTPLLEALKAEKLAQKDKETILKAHAHYHRSAQLDGRDRGKGTAASKQVEEGGAGRKGKRSGRKGEGAKDNAAGSAKGGPAPAGQGKGDGSPAKPGRAPRDKDRDALSIIAQGTEGAEGGKDTGKERERRARPAIGVGLASRQFEAALSGAGVLPPGGADRKSRREREKERKEAVAAAGETFASQQGKIDGDDSKPTTSSPSRDRTRGGGRRRSDGPKSPPLGPQKSKADAPPIILGRIDDAPPPSPSPARAISWPDPSSNTLVDPQGSPPRGRGRGGGRGGRRGGRGRGGPPPMGRGAAADT